MQIFSCNGEVESHKINVLVNLYVPFVVMYQFIVQVAFGYHFSLLDQTQRNLHNLQHTRQTTDTVKVQLHPLMHTIAILEFLKIEMFHKRVQRQFLMTIHYSLPEGCLASIDSVSNAQLLHSVAIRTLGEL